MQRLIAHRSYYVISMAIRSVLILVILFANVVQVCSYSYERCSHINFHTPDDRDCTSFKFCDKTYNISYIKMPPYAPTKGVQRFINLCCGNCTKYQIINTFRNISEVSPASINSSHFVYPFLGSLNDMFVHGYHFIPVMQVPLAYYITVRKDVTLFHSIFHLYPLVTICLIMAAIAGFICWVAETGMNQGEFPRSFPRGWFEGFWWSFITMTTVGYGDKCPRTMIGRLFAIAWILMGITACGILTAMLTTTIIDANTPKEPVMTGAKVGVLRWRQYDSLLVSHHGGLLVRAESSNFEDSVYELVKKLSEGKIDGLLLDRYTLWFVVGNFTTKGEKSNSTVSNPTKKELIEFMRESVLSSMEYRDEILSYGILVKNEEDFLFMNDVIRSNRFMLQTHLDSNWNKEQKVFFHRHPPGLFDAERPYFKTASTSLCCAIILICIFGTFYEIKKNKHPHSKKNELEGNQCIKFVGKR